MAKTRLGFFGGALIAVTSLMLAGPDREVVAADHLDAPAITSDAAGDITDFYAWIEGDSVYMAIAFAGLSEAGLPATYDSEVVYGVHIDNDGDAVADRDLWVRFGQSSGGDWGVQVEGLAGTDALVGPVEEVIEGPLNQRVFAGLRDDAFFFDLEGFQDTLMTGDLSFDSSRDFFAGVNVTAIVIEASLDAVGNGSEPFDIWATTRR